MRLSRDGGVEIFWTSAERTNENKYANDLCSEPIFLATILFCETPQKEPGAFAGLCDSMLSTPEVVAQGGPNL
jgi:hypothetical protein